MVDKPLRNKRLTLERDTLNLGKYARKRIEDVSFWTPLIFGSPAVIHAFTNYNYINLSLDLTSVINNLPLYRIHNLIVVLSIDNCTSPLGIGYNCFFGAQ